MHHVITKNENDYQLDFFGEQLVVRIFVIEIDRDTAQKMKFSINNFFTKWCQIQKKLWIQVCNFLKETPTQVFSCEICQMFKNNYFEEHLRTVTSDT